MVNKNFHLSRVSLFGFEQLGPGVYSQTFPTRGTYGDFLTSLKQFIGDNGLMDFTFKCGKKAILTQSMALKQYLNKTFISIMSKRHSIGTIMWLQKSENN